MAVMFLLLNPSTATEVVTDPTVARCVKRARRMGFGGIEVCNLYAFRSTDPKALYEIDDPVGPDNVREIKAAAAACSVIILGWGKPGFAVSNINRDTFSVGWGRDEDNPDAIYSYSTEVIGWAASHCRHSDKELLCLGVNKDGSPKHPLYISGKTEPVPFEVPL